MTTGPIDPIRLAIPSKGHLYDGIIELLKTAGYKVRRASDRQYEATIVGHGRVPRRLHAADRHRDPGAGRALSSGRDGDGRLRRARRRDRRWRVVVVPDLGYGGCRLAVAVPESWIDVSHIMDLVDLTTEFKTAGRTFRVSTKYPALVRQYFRKFGIYYYQLIDSEGALELHPSLGIADIIVDLTSSGTTLKDNRLREIEGGTVLESASCLIGHAPSLARADGRRRETVRWLTCSTRSMECAARRAGCIWRWWAASRPRGPRRPRGRHSPPGAGGLAHRPRRSVGRPGSPGWRVTASARARKLTACRRALFRLGASRVVGLPPRIVFDRDASSTFDDLSSRVPHLIDRSSTSRWRTQSQRPHPGDRAGISTRIGLRRAERPPARIAQITTSKPITIRGAQGTARPPVAKALCRRPAGSRPSSRTFDRAGLGTKLPLQA